MDDEIEMIEVYHCQNEKCHWVGESFELVDANGNGKFDQCPFCDGTEFYIDEEESGYA